MTLIQKGRDLDASMGNAISWLRNSNSVDLRTIRSLNEARRSVSKMTKSLEQKNVFTVFGASQVGKSYLVKNLLSVDNKPLNIDLGNDDFVDFIKDINPHGGGKESTGIVSRFTIDKVKNTDFPVELRLLSVKDLILIFSRSAFSQITAWSPVQRDEILSSLNHLDKSEWEPSNCKIPLTRFEVDEIFDSLESEFMQYKSFWNELANLDYIKYIEENIDSICSSIDHFDAVFNIIWRNSNHLNSLFKELLELYSTLNFESNVYVKKRAILNDVVNDVGDALLDVSCVSNMAGDTKTIDVLLTASNVSTKVLRGGLSVISKEIVLNVEERIAETREFLKRTDFMDFPGARSNIEINADSDLQMSTDQLSPADIYIRGKVSYLFDKYSQDFEINNLLFCIPCLKNEVGQLPGLLSSWINRNIGSTPADREKALVEIKTSPLMIVFTWWNIELQPYASDNQSFDIKWERRFDEFFEKQMVSDHVWFNKWTETKPKFSDFYFLRDFNESHPESQHGGGVFAGFDAINNLPETGLQLSMPPDFDKFSNPEDYMDELKQSFLSYPFIQQNIDNPEEVWNATSTPGNDGSELIAEILHESSFSSPKERRASQLFSESKSKFIDILSDIVRDDDPAIRLREIKALIQEIRSVFLPHIQKKSSFIHEFQNFLSTDLSEVYPILNQHKKVEKTNGDVDVNIFLQLYDISLDMPLSKILSKLSNYLGISEANVAAYVLENHRINLKLLCQSDLQNDESSWVVNVIMELAEKKFERAEKLDYLVEYGIDHQLLVRLFDQYKDGIINRKLSNKLESQIATVDNIMIGVDDLEWMANLICKWWNEFVFECDSRFYSDDELEQLNNSIEDGHYKISKFTREVTDNETAFAKMTDLFGTDQMSNNPSITSLPGIFKLKEWLHNLERMMILNAGGDAFDQEDQAELVQIYDSLRNTDISSL
ncbi:MAG: hypothetical protein CL847_05585 [Crocinitomicaceae bacterium]|nr:hypothetical protein [Crocinitomicaceae bacterium]